MKVGYKTLIYLGQETAYASKLDNEERCEMAYELLTEAFNLVPVNDDDEHVAKIYEAIRDNIEQAIEGIS